MSLTFLMVYRVGMQDTFDVLAFRSVFNFDTPMEENIMNQEIPCSIHGDPDSKEKTDVKISKKTSKYENNRYGGEEQSKDIVFLKSLSGVSMVVLMEEPSKPMHHVLMKEPSDSLHKEKGKNHDEDIQGYEEWFWHDESYPTKKKNSIK